MNTIIKKSLQSLLIVPALALGVSMVGPVLSPTAPTAHAQIRSGADAANTDEQPDTLFGPSSIFTTVVNVLLFIIGAVAVIMLIYGGLRYVLSGGDASAVTSAKNTILYAVVGIIVAILAYAVVNYVVTQFTGVEAGAGGGAGNVM